MSSKISPTKNLFIWRWMLLIPLNGKERLCLREMCSLLLFCHQDVSRSLPSILLLIPSVNFFGSSDKPLTCADPFNDMRRFNKIAALTTNSSICHDLYIAGASNTEKGVSMGENEHKCLCSKSTYTDPISSFSSLVAPPFLPSRAVEEAPTSD